MKSLPLTQKLLLAVLALASSSVSFAMGSKIPEDAPKWGVTDLQFQQQQQEYWCWAATTRIALSKIKSNSELPSQCEIVSKTIGKNCCPRYKNQVLPEGCNQGGNMHRVLNTMSLSYTTKKAYRGGPWDKPNTSIFDEVINWTKQKKVAIIHHGYTGTTPSFGTHVITAFMTYQKQNGEFVVVAYDPYYGRLMHFDRDSIFGAHKWLEVYFVKN